MGTSPVQRLLERAASRVDRVSPDDAYAAGAVLVDIRSPAARARDGVVPGSIHVPLTVLQWRLEPGGASRTPHVRETARVVLLCDHGCSSLLAAESLVELGVDATDVIGGIAGWREAGLPLVRTVDAPLAPDELQGMRPPHP